jgi:integrase
MDRALTERHETSGEGTFALVRRWQVYLEVSETACANTRRQYRRYLIAFLADTLLELTGLTEDDVVEWLKEQPAQGNTRGMTLRALRSFYRWAEDHDVCRSPVRRLRPKRPKYGPAPSLSRDQLEGVLAAAEGVDPRARWALQLAYATACRVGSLCALEAGDVDLETDWITFRVAKGDKPYGIALGPRGHEAVVELLALADYAPKRGRRRATLVGVGTGTVWKWAREAGELAGVKTWPHLLRHTTITRLAEENVDVRTVMEIANWDDPRLIRRYAAKSDPNLRRAVAIV